jgi:hypothetical protein
MPRGVLQWFDDRAGEGRVTAAGREYPAYERDVERRARRAGAPVHFDVERVDGVPTAVRVRLRPGTRTSPTQRRVGNQAGAGRPEGKARGGLTRRHPDLDPMLSGRPIALVRRWVASAESGRLDAVLPLYAPQAVLHAQGDEKRGRRAIRTYLVDSGLLSRGWEPEPRGVDDTVEIARGPFAPDAGLTSRFRIAHGQIVEQWVEGSGGSHR